MGAHRDRVRARVRLSVGRHREPVEGACVMEVVAMLAGEPFSDRPRCVSPSIGGFLRAYNDGACDRLRHDLYRVAAKVVGSRGSERVEQLRERRCRELVVALADERTGWRRHLPWPAPRSTGPESAGDELGEAVLRLGPAGHARVLDIVEELLWLGAPPPPPAREPISALLDRRPPPEREPVVKGGQPPTGVAPEVPPAPRRRRFAPA